MKRIPLLILLALTSFACKEDTAAPHMEINSPIESTIYSNQKLLPIRVTLFGAYDVRSVRYYSSDKLTGLIDHVDDFEPSFLVISDYIPILNLEPGKHTLTFEVTDDNSNINSEQITFEVE